MFILGITGQSGAGKGAVSEKLTELGFYHIDADKTARVVVEKGKPCLLQLVKFFSKDILNPDGTLNRKKLAHLAFACGGLENLNSIILPYVLKEFINIRNEKEKQGVKYIALDAPTLFESKADKLCSKILYVTSSKPLRVKRIMERDNISETLALERIGAEKTDEFYKSLCDYVIENNGDKFCLEDKINRLFKEISKISQQ